MLWFKSKKKDTEEKQNLDNNSEQSSKKSEKPKYLSIDGIIVVMNNANSILDIDEFEHNGIKFVYHSRLNTSVFLTEPDNPDVDDLEVTAGMFNSKEHPFYDDLSNALNQLSFLTREQIKINENEALKKALEEQKKFMEFYNKKYNSTAKTDVSTDEIKKTLWKALKYQILDIRHITHAWCQSRINDIVFEFDSFNHEIYIHLVDEKFYYLNHKNKKCTKYFSIKFESKEGDLLVGNWMNEINSIIQDLNKQIEQKELLLQEKQKRYDATRKHFEEKYKRKA